MQSLSVCCGAFYFPSNACECNSISTYSDAKCSSLSILVRQGDFLYGSVSDFHMKPGLKN